MTLPEAEKHQMLALAQSRQPPFCAVLHLHLPLVHRPQSGSLAATSGIQSSYTTTLSSACLFVVGLELGLQITPYIKTHLLSFILK